MAGSSGRGQDSVRCMHWWPTYGSTEPVFRTIVPNITSREKRLTCIGRFAAVPERIV